MSQNHTTLKQHTSKCALLETSENTPKGVLLVHTENVYFLKLHTNGVYVLHIFLCVVATHVKVCTFGEKKGV